jgi:hypothetical protein
VVVLAALIGGGTAVGVQQWQARQEQHTDEPGPTTSGTLPDGWVRRTDPYGFSIALPGPEWQRTVFDEATRQVDYSPDGGEHFFRIAVDPKPDFDDPYEHQLDLEQQVRRLFDYRRLSMRQNTYRDRPGALWEYTWSAQDQPEVKTKPGPRRAIDQMYISRDGVEYALYASSPAADWATTRKQFDTLLRGWRPKSS